MTTLRFEPKVGTGAQESLESHVRPLYDHPAGRRLFIGELVHTERTQPAPGSDKEPLVKVRIVSLEIPNQEQEEHVREALRFLYLQRTARGTLDDDGQLELDEQTLRLTGGLLAYVETARLEAGVRHWASYARRVSQTTELSATEARQELKNLADALAALHSDTRKPSTNH
ncbi:hypothetical protein ACFXHD_25320 [Streptomyces hydrogenans]|uniref:hypothetical protein n=1 Tax=Streptomyces hydrogenans TaxID=1873719 RepID=UPI0036C37811